jgi:hypothetical protein
MGCDRGFLHLRHDRRSEGRRHASPRRLPERRLQCGDLDHAALPGLSLDPADVPLQRLVLPLDGRDARRHARCASTESITTAPPRSCTTC